MLASASLTIKCYPQKEVYTCWDYFIICNEIKLHFIVKRKRKYHRRFQRYIISFQGYGDYFIKVAAEENLVFL